MKSLRRIVLVSAALGMVGNVAMAETTDGRDANRAGAELDASVREGERNQQASRMGDARSNQVHPDDAQEIRALLGDVVDAALEGDVDEISGYLAKADKERINNADNVRELDTIGDRIGDSWRTKYNETLNFDQSSQELAAVFSDISAGQDKKHINVRLPGEGTMLRLVDEGVLKTTWRLDIPDNVTAQELTQSLKRELSELQGKTASLPGNVAEGRKMVAAQVLSCLGEMDKKV